MYTGLLVYSYIFAKTIFAALEAEIAGVFFFWVRRLSRNVKKKKSVD
jgi:hypothetical protein